MKLYGVYSDTSVREITDYIIAPSEKTIISDVGLQKVEIKVEDVKTFFYIFVNSKEIEKFTITVGKNCDYSTIQDVLQSINDSSEYRQYTIYINEGTYDITDSGINALLLKPYVSFQGANKAKTIIKHCEGVTTDNNADSSKNIFDVPANIDLGIVEIKNMTLITSGIKGCIHLDSSWTGTVYMENLILNNDNIPENDYNIYCAGSRGCINCAVGKNQIIHVNKCIANGYIWTHDRDQWEVTSEEKAIFKVENTICDYLWIGSQSKPGNRHAIFTNNQMNCIRLISSDMGYYWNILLNGNKLNYISAKVSDSVGGIIYMIFSLMASMF